MSRAHVHVCRVTYNTTCSILQQNVILTRATMSHIWLLFTAITGFRCNDKTVIHICLTSVTRAKPKEKMEFPA